MYVLQNTSTVREAKLAATRNLELDLTVLFSQWTLKQWSKSSKMNLQGLSGDTSLATRTRCDPIDGYVHVCNGNYGRTSWNGRASWSYSMGYGSNHYHIVSCTVRFNDFEYVYSGEKKLMCHEFGHCLVSD